MKKGLDANTAFQGKKDNTREDGLLMRLSQALEEAGVTSGYTRLQDPKPGDDGLFI